MHPARLVSGPVAVRRSWRLDDPARLRGLADYRDPDPRRLHELQEVVALASRLLRAGIALLALVERDRVVAHAVQGTRPLARIPVSPIWEAILGSDPLFVWQADPLEDPTEIPVLTPGAGKPGLFIAAPLVSPGQAVIGALCVTDPTPRPLSADDRAALTVLARQAMSLMELHRLVRREAAGRDAAADLADRMQRAFSVAGLGDWRWDAATGLTTLSARAARIYDLPADVGLAPAALRSRIAPEHHEQSRRRLEAAIRERREYHLEFRLRAGDRGEAWAQAHGIGVEDAGGHLVEIVGVVQDITARRLAEAQMRIREDRASMKAELINRVQDLDAPGDVAIHAIRVVVERLGLDCGGFSRIDRAGRLASSPTRTVGGIGRLQCGLGIDRLDAALLDRLAAAAPVEVDLAAMTPPRTAQLCPLIRQGRPVALFWFLADRERGWRDGEALAIQSIVDLGYAYYGRAQARRSAKAGERRLMLVADWMPQLAWLANRDGRPVWFNQRWREYGGCSLEALLGDGWLPLCHPDDRPLAEATIARAQAALADGRDGGWEVTIRIRRADGRYRWHLSRAIAFTTGDDEEPLLWFGTMTDVSAQRQLAEKREALLETERLARLEAEGASRMKDDFLATLSHELRTPLTAVLGWAQVLRRTRHDPDLVGQGIEIIERNARLQSQIVEDLLDMSAIASGKLRLECRREPLAPLVEAAIETVAPLARSRGIAIDFEAGDGSFLVVDPSRLLQVLHNLLDNALKFSPDASRIRVRLDAVDRVARLVIADEGIGMTAEFLPHVFERFRQADASNTRLHGGLGLGLAIVRQLLDLHGATIEAASPGVGRGSTFTIRLPLAIEG